MFESFLRVLILLAAIVAVVFAGWNEPLRYRFLGANQIAQEEQAIRPTIAERDSPNDWQPQGTSLDRAPYRVRNGVVRYSRNFDPKHTGTSTETPWRPNAYRGGTWGMRDSGSAPQR